ncbi:MAG: hypothetical protein HUU29_01235 [Planctomycetaceae bacterium]|nr:hypothetical protein [Planctomycetaceae bacterium]
MNTMSKMMVGTTVVVCALFTSLCDNVVGAVAIGGGSGERAAEGLPAGPTKTYTGTIRALGSGTAIDVTIIPGRGSIEIKRGGAYGPSLGKQSGTWKLGNEGKWNFQGGYGINAWNVNCPGSGHANLDLLGADGEPGSDGEPDTTMQVNVN